MAATLKTPKKFRSWKNEDSFDQSDVVRLFDAEKVKTTKSVNCWKYWSIYCALVGFFVLFFIGILIGFLLRADSKVNSCSYERKRADGFDRDKLQAVHNNIVFLMSEENIAKYSRELSALTYDSSSLSPGGDDKQSAEYVAKKFRQYGFDKVEIENHDIVVTSPDPLQPNRLEIMSTDGSTKKNYTFHGGFETKGSHSSKYEPQELQVEFSPSGSVKGPLMYGNYGRYIDFVQLEASNLVVRETVILVKIGHNSVAEKVKLAEKHGCAGVLLFCHQADPCYHSNSNGHLVISARDFTDFDNDGLPTIPVQTVSHHVAMDLIGYIPDTSLPSPWQQHKLQNHSKVQENETMAVYLQVNNKKSTRTIHNVVATIYGSPESDRQILLGGRRHVEQSATGDFDPASNTGTLLELARSMAYIRDRELWKPRRTLKFVSFGGYVRDVGMNNYIKYNRHILIQEAVTYIDLDAVSQGSKVMEFRSSPSVANLLFRTSDMIPDPLNPELSLVENWPTLSHDWYLSNGSAVNMYSSGEFPLFHRLGIPSISLFSLQSIDEQLQRGATAYKSYRLAAARVVSLTTLKLLDDLIIPINSSFLLQFINSSIYHSVLTLNHHISGQNFITDRLLTVSHQLFQLGYDISQLAHNCSDIRETNDFLMRFESVFMDGSFEERLLSVSRQSGSLTAFSDVKNSFSITKNRDTVNSFIKRIIDVLQEAIKEIQTLKKR